MSENRENARAANRAAMPAAAGALDALRAAFGDAVTLVYAAENGRVLDKRPPPDPNLAVWHFGPSDKPGCAAAFMAHEAACFAKKHKVAQPFEDPRWPAWMDAAYRGRWCDFVGVWWDRQRARR